MLNKFLIYTKDKIFESDDGLTWTLSKLQINQFTSNIEYDELNADNEEEDGEEEEKDEEAKKRTLLIDVPTALFPSVRALVTRLTSESGFPPFAMQPVDFEAMYEQKESYYRELYSDNPKL